MLLFLYFEYCLILKGTEREVVNDVTSKKLPLGEIPGSRKRAEKTLLFPMQVMSSPNVNY